MAQSQFPLPASFNSSSLVRWLASLDVAPAADSKQTFAEKLSHWVAWTDAIALSGALETDATADADAMQTGASARVDMVVAQLQRLRKELTEAVANDAILSGAKWGKVGPVAAPGAAVNRGDVAEFDFAAYRRSYVAHQRTMEERIGAFRAAVRAVAAAHSPALGQLAALDAAMDTALVTHQRRVTAGLSMLLEKRFKSAPQPLQGRPAGPEDAPALAPGKPPAGYGQTLQAVLLAEMVVRLQPVEGMIDALGARFTGQT